MSKNEEVFPPTHKWAGQARCQQRVFDGRWRYYQCDKKATKDDNTMCGTHCADAVAKRKAKADARFLEYSRDIDRKQSKHNAIQAILDAARTALSELDRVGSHNDTITITIKHSVAVAATKE